MNKNVYFLVGCLIILPFLAWLATSPATVIPKQNRSKIKAYLPPEDEPIILPGEIKADRQVSLRFQSSGLLIWVGVRKGDKVEKGQVLASLDKRELEKTLKKEMNDYLNERWDFEQTNDDYQEEKDHHLITDGIKRILEKAQFDLNNVVLDYEIQNLALEYATLTSPIDGIVTDIEQPIAGVNITPATAEITITDPSSVYFQLEADEEKVTWLKENMSGKIILDAYPEREFDTVISNISFTPKSTTGSAVYTAHCLLSPNNNLQFRLGMAGEIEISNSPQP